MPFAAMRGVNPRKEGIGLPRARSSAGNRNFFRETIFSSPGLHLWPSPAPGQFAPQARMRFVQLAVQLVDFLTGLAERPPARRSDPVDAPSAPRRGIHRRFQQSGPLHSVQHWIERTRTDAIAVMRQLRHHLHAEDRLLGRMQQHVNADQPIIEFAPMVRHRNEYSAGLREVPCANFLYLLSNFDIMSAANSGLPCRASSFCGCLYY